MELNNFYTARRQAFGKEAQRLAVRSNMLGIARLAVSVIFLVLGYYCFLPGDKTLLFCGMAIVFAAFILLMRYHAKVSRQKQRAEALEAINKDEYNYINGNGIPFQDGAVYADPSHPYAHDLDIFGKKSLFHNLNRTETYNGGQKLAAMLMAMAAQEEIQLNQEAIKELAAKPEWRQELMALGRMGKDSSADVARLMAWANRESSGVSRMAGSIAIISPVLLLISFIVYLITDNGLFSDIAQYLALFNLAFVLRYLKPMKREIADTTEIYRIIEGYGLMIKSFENESFTSRKLKSLQSGLTNDGQKASSHILKLSVLFSRLDSLGNILGAMLSNGLFLFHLHTLRSLLSWKKQHAVNINLWLDSIAGVEALSSLANLSFNNPDFAFPKLNSEYRVIFTNLSHPLIRREARVGNDVRFSNSFMILTGSNMSGKSTFLRSLGVNMVLAGTGTPVCAGTADIHPLPVLASMRLADSLSDSESYFFAEVKRLQSIMLNLEKGSAFVLLDEILRGTNSDDKYTGTIKVIERMVALKAVGAIATHDVEVCRMTESYPGVLSNHCFEAQIVNDELYFDYQLREGVCQNRSATFLMQKMGVIQV